MPVSKMSAYAQWWKIDDAEYHIELRGADNSQLDHAFLSYCHNAVSLSVVLLATFGVNKNTFLSTY